MSFGDIFLADRQTKLLAGTNITALAEVRKLSSGVLKQDHCYSLISTVQTLASSLVFKVKLSDIVTPTQVLDLRKRPNMVIISPDTCFTPIACVPYLTKHCNNTSRQQQIDMRSPASAERLNSSV